MHMANSPPRLAAWQEKNDTASNQQATPASGRPRAIQNPLLKKRDIITMLL